MSRHSSKEFLEFILNTKSENSSKKIVNNIDDQSIVEMEWVMGLPERNICFHIYYLFLGCSAFGLSVLILLLMSNTLAVVLECEFEYVETYGDLDYACIAGEMTTTKNDRSVTKIAGAHLDDESNETVVKLLVESGSCPYMPLNISSHFKNLEILYIMHSGLEFLTAGDLEGFTKLRMFDVSHNPIKALGKDFFKGQRKIQSISFYGCELEYIQPGVLDPLVNLRIAYFDKNVCIDFQADGSSMIASLKAKFREKCGSLELEELKKQSNTEASKTLPMSTIQPFVLFPKRFSEIIMLCLGGMLVVSLVVNVILITKNCRANRNFRNSIKLRESF